MGAFCQPKLVVCDTDTLSTLPAQIFRDGCAEVIKYGVLFDPQLFSQLTRDGMNFDREWVIARCIGHKRDVVEKDEFDNGQRKLLNFGHTVAHALEQCSKYTLSHGQAVSIGMAVIARASAAKGICAQNTAEQIVSLLDAFSLPTATSFSPQELANAALSDKKRRGAAIDLILPDKIGQCLITPTPTEVLQDLFAAGM